MKKEKSKPPVEIDGQDFEVKNASVKDDICDYSIHVKQGIAVGTHNVKGEGYVDEDLKIAFSKLNVHLAIIDGVFKHKGIEIDKINKFHGHENTVDYTVSGFKMKGEEDNLSIILDGTKHVDMGIMDVTSPKILLGMGGYPFFKELKAAADKAILEVELYIQGKCTPVDPVESSDSKQLTVIGAIEDAENAFEKARVK